MVYGLKISKPGINVGTATNSSDLVFDSDLNTLKVKTTGTTNGTSGGIVAHGLSYVPIYFCVNSNGTNAGLIGDTGLSAGVDGTNVYTPAKSRYYIFYQDSI